MSKDVEKVKVLAEEIKLEVSLWELYGILYNMNWYKRFVVENGDTQDEEDIDDTIREFKETFAKRVEAAYIERDISGDKEKEEDLKDIVDCFGNDGWLDKVWRE